jgi:small subunit ribosomal protein S1
MSDQQPRPPATNRTRRRGPESEGEGHHGAARTAPVDVAVRGRGHREDTPPATAKVGPVTVSEDLDFAALMGAGEATGVASFERGARVRGVVESISVHGEEVFLDLGQKETGFIMKEELRDADGNLVVKVGDVVEGTVAGRSTHGLQIRTKLGQEATSAAIREAFEGGLVVEGKVTAHNKGGYEVEIGKTRAFCPHSQIDTVRVEDPETMIGRVFDFKITELRDGGSPVVSRTALLKASAAARAEALMATLAPGQIVRGRVRNIQKFGVFVDLGGKDGLIPMSELAWSRVEDAAQVVALGQEIDVKVLEISNNGERIGLSLKKTQSHPFEVAAEKLHVGQAVAGMVKRLEAFGAFVEIAPDVEGLVHISDMAHYRVKHPKDVLKVGDVVRVKVQEVDLERSRVSLSLKALTVDPWEGVALRYPVGTEINGMVEKVADFGVFITIEPGITGLLPGSESQTGGRSLADEFRAGKAVTARILRVEPGERKIALTRRDPEEIARLAERGDDVRARRNDTLREVREGRGGRDDGRGPRGGGGTTVAYRDETPKGEGDVGALGAALLKALGKKG